MNSLPKNFSTIGVILCLLNGSTVLGQKNGADQLLVPFGSDEVILKSSWVKLREDLNRDYLYSLDPDRLLHNFRINAGITSNAPPLEGWENPQIGLRGHFVGHYLSACASLVKNHGDSLLLTRIVYMVDALEVCQQKLGGKYLSAFPEGDFATLETKFGGVWAPYYTYHKIMQGLLDVYVMTGNRKAYNLVVNMAAYVNDRMSKLSEAAIEKMLYTADANPTNEPGAMNEVLQNLFSISGDSLHLKLAMVFDRTWFSKPLTENKSILSGLHSNTHLVLVNGYARRYENTQELYYRQASVNFWNMLQHHSYVNGSSSGPRPVANTPTSQTAEHWGVADRLSSTLTSEIAESCVTHNTQRLTSTLFRWTAAPKYADAYMNTFYNAVMALQSSKTGLTVYHLPLGSPQKKKFLKDNDFKCCSGTGIEAFARLNWNIYFHDAHNIWINLYAPSRLQWKERHITVEQEGNFPEKNELDIKVDTEVAERFVINLFIPSWAGSQTKVLINGKAIESTVRPLSFLPVSRLWKKGDRIKVIFNYSFQLKPMPDNDNIVSLSYGPVLLAFETEREIVLKGTRDDILKSIARSGSEFSFELKNVGYNYRLIPFYEINSQSYGVYATIRNEY